MPSMAADGAHAANLGGSSLAIPATSDNKEAAWAYVNYALGTNEGQVTMLREYGLVPSLLSALDDPFVAGAAAASGATSRSGRWCSARSTRSSRSAARRSSATPTRSCRRCRPQYLNGGYDSAQAALDDAAKQIELVTGLPIAE